mmetsp:Transcript_4454/g.5163  ORF Transcript_4454/g.5163 Transcript_4454/m.5163 type:complete len:133 (+) Transcript_4454:630-1028(+)
MGSSPSLEVKTAVRVLGIYRESKAVDVEIGEGGLDAEAFLAGPYIFLSDGSNHRAPQYVVICVVPFLTGTFARKRVDVLFRFLEDIERRIFVKFQILEGRRCRFGRRSGRFGGKCANGADQNYSGKEADYDA